MKTTAKIIAFNSKQLQRGLKTQMNIKPRAYVRLAGQPKPSNRVEFAGYCHA